MARSRLNTATSTATVQMDFERGVVHRLLHDAGEIGDRFDARERQHDRNERLPRFPKSLLGRDPKMKMSPVDLRQRADDDQQRDHNHPRRRKDGSRGRVLRAQQVERPDENDRDDRPQTGAIESPQRLGLTRPLRWKR